MARNGYISEDLAKRSQAEPIRIRARSAVKTHAPAAIEHVFDELKRAWRRALRGRGLGAGRISVRSTVDERVQTIVNEALETGLALYERRHPSAKGLIQGLAVVLRNADGAILAEAGGRQVYQDRYIRYSDYNRVTDSRRQAGSAFKPLLYLAAFREGLDLDTTVPDEPIGVPSGANGGVKWITNYDNRFSGLIPLRQALAESRNAVAVWLAGEIGMGQMIQTAQRAGIRTPLQPYLSTALGASEVALLELASAYRAIASDVLPSPTSSRACTTPPVESSTTPLDRVPEIESAEPAPDPGGSAGRDPPAERHRPRPRRARVPDPGDGQDRHHQRLPRRALRGLDLRPDGDHGGGADRLRRQPRAGRPGNREDAPRSRSFARSCSGSTATSRWGRRRSSPGDRARD